MRTVVLIASDVARTGNPVLPPGDRAAVQWGVLQSAAECQVRYPRGDRTAAAYVGALGATGTDWIDDESIAADLVLIGPGAIDLWGDELAGRLAERLSAELLFDVQQIKRIGTDWSIVCDAGRGARDVCRVAGRVVLVVSQQVSRPRYVSHYRRQQAARLIRVDEPPVVHDSVWQPVTPRPRRAASAADGNAEDRANSAFGIAGTTVTARNRQIIADTPAVCAQVLLRYLVHHGFLDRVLPEVSAPGVRVAEDASPSPGETDVAPRQAFGLGPALRRGPRVSGEDERRRARRPRPSAAALSSTRSLSTAALERGPRRSAPE